jgi:hypothetical protein
MNLCAVLYTQSFLYIFVCALLLVEATLQKAVNERSTPLPICLPVSFILFFFLSSQFSCSFPYVLVFTFSFIIIFILQLSSSSLISPLLPSYFRLFFFSLLSVLISACSYIHCVLFVPAMPEESPENCAITVAATLLFLLRIRGYLNFCRNKLLVELVWIWSQNESYHFDVMGGRGVGWGGTPHQVDSVYCSVNRPTCLVPRPILVVNSEIVCGHI